MEEFFKNYEHTIEFFSALGTVGAVLVSLGYAFYEYRSRKKDKQEATRKENGLELLYISSVRWYKECKPDDEVSIVFGLRNHLNYDVIINEYMLQFRPSKGFFNFFVQEKQTIPKYSRHTQLVLTQYTTDRENLYAVIKNLQLAFFSFDTNIGSINIQIPEHNIKQFKDNATDVLDGSNFSLFPK